MAGYSLDDFDLDPGAGNTECQRRRIQRLDCSRPAAPHRVRGGRFLRSFIAAPDASLTVVLDVDDHFLIDHAHPELADNLLTQGGEWHPSHIRRSPRWRPQHAYVHGQVVPRVASNA